MSTSEPAVAETEIKEGSARERAVAIGPGLVRGRLGDLRSPKDASFRVRCMGPIAFWEVTCSFELGDMVKGDAAPTFLYPLPAQSPLFKCEIRQSGAPGGTAVVKGVAELSNGQTVPDPDDQLSELFADESLPVLSLDLTSCLEKFNPGLPVEIFLVYGCGLPTVDGRIQVTIPGEYQDTLDVSGLPKVSAEIFLEDAGELVDEPVANCELKREQNEDIKKLSGTFDALAQDIDVNFRPGRTEMPVTRLRRDKEYFLFSIFPPTSIPASPQRRDIVFAVDASENVLGGLYKGLCEDLAAALRSLDDNDRFALVTYGRDIDGYDGGEFCEISEVEAACKWMETIEPKGRADVQPLLDRIQALPSQADRQLCVFLIAAGHVGNEPAILKSLDFDQSDRRYYNVGIGPTSKQAFLRRLAMLTRGRCEVATDRRCKQALFRLLGQTRALLAEVTFEGQDGPDAEIDNDGLVPSIMTSLTAQGPVHCMGKGTPSSLRFRSKDETGVFFAGTVNAKTTNNPALGGVWAGLRVEELLDSIRLTTGAKRRSLKAECCAIATKHGVLTEDTVLVVHHSGKSQVQLSVLPYRWDGGADTITEKPKSTGSAPFDWRKGLVARDGLFKGARPGGSGEFSRPGLRSRSAGSKTGKPMLDRHVSAPEPVEAQVVEGLPANGAPDQVVTVTQKVVVTVSTDPIIQLNRDPYAEGKVRMESYLQQMTSVDTRMALAALSGLPDEVTQSGPDLPRILAQTVAHLEKRGYYSAAVSVLGLLLRDFSSPEVLKKMESLLAGWAASLGEENLPEAIQILQAGRRVCPNSDLLGEKADETWEKWQAASEEQASLPEVKSWSSTETPAEPGQLLSGGTLHIARLESQQEKLASELAALKGLMEQQMGDLPAMLNKLSEAQAEAAAAAASAAAETQAALAQAQAQAAAEAEARASAAPAPAPPAAPPAPVPPEPVGTPEPTSAAQPEAEDVNLDLPDLGLESIEEEAFPSEELEAPEPDVAVAAPPEAVADPAPPEPVAAPAPEEPVAAPAPPEPVAAPAPPEPVAAPAPPEPVAEPAPPEPVAEPAPPEPVAEPAPPEPVAEPAPPEPVAEPAPPEPVAESAPPEPVVEPAPPEPVAEPAPPEPVAEPAPPEPVAEPAPPEPVAAPAPPEPVAAPADDDDDEDVAMLAAMSREDLMDLLRDDPRGVTAHKAIKVALPEPKDRISFYRDLVKADRDQPFHSLSLARAYREADQTKVAVVHYQKYLRSEKDGKAYAELADAYDELGKGNLSASARKAAELYA